MFTCRKFLVQAAGAEPSGGIPMLPSSIVGKGLPTYFAAAQASVAERNKQVVLGYKAAMKVKPRAAAQAESTASGNWPGTSATN